MKLELLEIKQEIEIEVKETRSLHEEVLERVNKTGIRKSVYAIDESMKEKFPNKIISGTLEEELNYSQNLINIIRENQMIVEHPAVKSNINFLQEVVEDDLEILKLKAIIPIKIAINKAFFLTKNSLAKR